jgi:hypothetical protein
VIEGLSVFESNSGKCMNLRKSSLCKCWKNYTIRDFIMHKLLPNIIRLTNSWRMRWVGQVTCMNDVAAPIKILVGKL